MSHEEDPLDGGGLAQTGGPRPFAPDELVACEKCARANPPTRMNCLYCGATLPVTEQAAKLRRPALKKLEEWERGFNVVLVEVEGAASSPEVLAEAASLLRLEASLLKECLAARRALPLARAASRAEAELIVERLGPLGLSVETLSDEELGMDSPPRRVRAFEFRDEGLSLSGSSGDEFWRWEEVGLLVLGRVVTKRVEVEERRAKQGRDGEIVDARELVADEDVLDLYTMREVTGRRVSAESFDYSCLGARKSLVARENFRTLTALLRERARAACFDDEYLKLRRLLAAAWPPAERDDTLGFKRERVGRYNTAAVTTVSNEGQFTRYSRLCWHARRRGLGDV